MKTTDGKVFPRMNSAKPLVIINTPPKKKYAAVSDAPNVPLNRQFKRMFDKGVKDNKNPPRALDQVSRRIADGAIAGLTLV